MDTIFTVKNKDLESLSPQEAVDFFRELLWAEATILGIGKDLINVPSAITVADGGIDAEVRNVQVDSGQGVIKQGLSRYQIKTGNFSLSKNHIKAILFKKNSNILKPKIKSCLDNKGRLVIVLFGWDNPEVEDNRLVNSFKEQLKNVNEKYEDIRIEIWRQNNIIGFLKYYPSLILELKGISDLQFQTHKSWSQNKDMQQVLVETTDYREKMETVRQDLRSTDHATHIRVIGEAGIGKTRFILEVTSIEDIAPLILYTKASAFIASSLLNYICWENNNFHVVVVVDECSLQQRIELWNLLSCRGSRIKLVTIYNEIEILDYEIVYPNIPKLSKDDVKKIILNYGIPQDQVDHWAELAGNSPRFAHMIGINLKNYPDDILRPVEGIYDRIIAGYEDPNSEEVKKRKRVLRCVALFKRFGYKGPVAGETKMIAKIVERIDRDISPAKFQEIIKTLKARNILQGENTLYISPKALHIRMWIEWWDNYEATFNLSELLSDLPENSSLRKWFYEMFRYAKESEVASNIVKKLLGPDGPFQNEN